MWATVRVASIWALYTHFVLVAQVLTPRSALDCRNEMHRFQLTARIQYMTILIEGIRHVFVQ